MRRLDSPRRIEQRWCELGVHAIQRLSLPLRYIPERLHVCSCLKLSLPGSVQWVQAQA